MIPQQKIAGREIQRIRQEREMTQSDMATACQVLAWDISRGTLAKIESGIRCVPDIEVDLLAMVLSCNPSDLLVRSFEKCLKMTVSAQG